MEELYRRYGHVIMRRCWSLLGREEDALDAMQEVFVRALRYGGRYRAEARPLPWLYQIATRVCYDRRRKRDREPPVETDQAPAPCGVDPERAAILVDLLERFDPLTREMALAYHLEEMSMDEVAKLVGRSRKTVGKRLARFHARAGALLSGRGDREDGP